MPRHDHSPMVSQQTLEGLLRLIRLAQQTQPAKALEFLLLNESHVLTPYDTMALWRDGQLSGVSAVLKPDPQAPLGQWLQQLFPFLHSQGDRARRLSASQIPPDLAQGWQDWPAHALWLPIPGSDASVLLGRQHAFSEAEAQVWHEWLSAWSHCDQALRQRKGGWFGKGTRQAGGRTWRQFGYSLAGLALVGLGFLPVPLTVLAPAELVPIRPEVVRAPMDGIVAQVMISPNTPVHEGQVLVQLDERPLLAKLEVAEQSWMSAQADYRQNSQLALRDARARSQLAMIASQMAEKRAEVDYLRQLLAQAQIRAHRSGVALFDSPQDWLGKPVSMGERILRIADPAAVEVEVWVGLSDLIPLQPGSPLRLHLNANPLESLEAQVEYLAFEAAKRPDGSFAYRLRARLVNPPAHIRVGAKGTARIAAEEVTLAYWLLRKPLASLRALTGL